MSNRDFCKLTCISHRYTTCVSAMLISTAVACSAAESDHHLFVSSNNYVSRHRCYLQGTYLVVLSLGARARKSRLYGSLRGSTKQNPSFLQQQQVVWGLAVIGSMHKSYHPSWYLLPSRRIRAPPLRTFMGNSYKVFNEVQSKNFSLLGGGRISLIFVFILFFFFLYSNMKKKLLISYWGGSPFESYSSTDR